MESRLRSQTKIASAVNFFPNILNTPIFLLLSDKYHFLIQLNMYNFHRLKTNDGLVQFRHQLFRKNYKYHFNYLDNSLSLSKENRVKQKYSSAKNY
jgi:hypothetical protein